MTNTNGESVSRWRATKRKTTYPELGENKTQLKDAILSNTVLAEGIVKEDFTYSSATHGLTYPGSTPDTFRVAFFRAVYTDSDSIINRPAEDGNAGNSQFGAGLYGGNCSEAVAHYGWPENKTVKLFLSPEITETDVLDDSYLQGEKLRELRDLTRVRLGVINQRVGVLNQAAFDERYSNARVVIMTKPFDVKLSQRLQAGPFDYPVNPSWYLWRDKKTDCFEQVGETTHYPKQREQIRTAVRFIVGKSNE